jgi:uncharacterized protein (TIGR02996 family)
MRDALEAKILANPDDLETWRVYADWLLDAGDPRGALVDLEHQLASEPMPPARRAELLARVVALRAPIEAKWSAAAPAGTRLQWRFGFIVGATLYSWWAEREELAFLESVAGDPVGRFLTRLRVRSHCGLKGIDALAAWPVLGQLRELVLADIGISWSNRYDGFLGYHGLDLLAASPYIGGLQILDVSGNLLGAPGRQPSSSSSGNPFRPAVALTDNKGEVLARFRGLTALRLRGCHLGDAGVTALVGPGGLEGLISLDLTDNALGPAGARAIASSPLLGGLETLVLRDNPIGAEGVAALAASKGLGSLETLDLGYTGAEESHVAAAGRAPAPRDLGELGELATQPLAGVFYFRAHHRYPGGNADMFTIKVTLLRLPGQEPVLRATRYSNWDGSHYLAAEAPLPLDAAPLLPRVLASARQLVAAGATDSRFTCFDGRLDSDEYDTEWSSLELALFVLPAGGAGARPEDGTPLLRLCLDAVYAERRGAVPPCDPPDAVSQAFVDDVMRLCGIGRVQDHSNALDDFSRTFRGDNAQLEPSDDREMPVYL